MIISGTIQVLLGVTVFGRPVADAVATPRIHHQGAPPVLVVEPGVPPEVRAVLARVGHRIVEMPSLGAVSAVARAADGRMAAAGDSRKDGGAATVP